jgi:hypothetical protein
MKHKTILTLLTGLFVLMALAVQAQSSPACSPKACGPENTKTKEAKVITDMRTQLEIIVDQLAQKENYLDIEITKKQLSPGDNDDESLKNIYDAALSIRQVLLKNVESGKLLPALKEPVQPHNTTQQLVARLRTEIDLLSEQVQGQ